jgi:hypothetical protein
MIQFKQAKSLFKMFRGEILRPQESSDSQTIVFRYKEIGGILCAKHRRNGIVSIYRILGQEITFFQMFLTQYIPDFLVAEHYGLRKTTFWGSKDLASFIGDTTTYNS